MDVNVFPLPPLIIYIYIYMNLCVSICTYRGEYIHVPLENGLQTSPKIGLLEAHLGSSILELLQ